MPPKGSPAKKKKVKKGMWKAKNTLITMPTSDSDESQSILDPGPHEGCLAGGSNVEDGHGVKGGEASYKRSRPEATVTSVATLSEQETEGQEEGPPPPKKSNVSNSLNADKE